ncbi:DoxX family protein [Metabacillus sp. GX 13764]|uniref:DoxX family protein n=1 Tax=Metabacillus kandeliae TaxID=2900151 RepID=UPI001E5161E6|nr:DoxX family protein [Metabacillus kandeliae]MCD7034082.1 DoxX family protein [Metabacillus kandeliae]
MGILLFILQIILGVGFLLFGFMKFGAKQMNEEFERYGYSAWFRIVTGIVEIAGAVLVIAGFWNATAAAWGALLISLTMIGALITHIKVKDSFSKSVSPLVFLILGLVVLIFNWGSLF